MCGSNPPCAVGKHSSSGKLTEIVSLSSLLCSIFFDFNYQVSTKSEPSRGNSAMKRELASLTRPFSLPTHCTAEHVLNTDTGVRNERDVRKRTAKHWNGGAVQIQHANTTTDLAPARDTGLLRLKNRWVFRPRPVFSCLLEMCHCSTARNW